MNALKNSKIIFSRCFWIFFNTYNLNLKAIGGLYEIFYN